jgi:hypothetical protein
VRDRHLKFHEDRDNLSRAAPTANARTADILRVCAVFTMCSFAMARPAMVRATGRSRRPQSGRHFFQPHPVRGTLLLDEISWECPERGPDVVMTGPIAWHVLTLLMVER